MAEEHLEAPKTEAPEHGMTPAVDSIKEALEKSRPVFEGHPAEGAPVIPAPAEDATPPEPEPPVIKEAAPPEPKPELKFKDHMAAEQGYKEVEKLVGRKESERQALQEEVQRLTTKLEEIQGQVAERAGELTESEASQILLEGLKGMQDVSDKDPEYLQKISMQWAKSILAVMGKVSKVNEDKIIEKAVELSRGEARAADNEAAAWNYAVDTAQKAGLDMRYNIGTDNYGAPIHSESYEVFWDSVLKAPKGLTVEEQVQYAVDRTKRILGSKATSPQAVEVAKKVQTERTPLGQHGQIPAPV